MLREQRANDGCARAQGRNLGDRAAKLADGRAQRAGDDDSRS